MSIRCESGPFEHIYGMFRHHFVHSSRKVDVGKWQSVDVSDKPEMVTYELLDCTMGMRVPRHQYPLQDMVNPNLPWAEDHFQERVSGIPHNPPPSHEWWPFAQQSNAEFSPGGKFSHTYPERFWPKFANTGGITPEGRHVFVPHVGLRYAYGDLDDVVQLLLREPLTRQAFLPVWFPEDTGSGVGQRVPCTLGYHFINREDALHCVYYIRSCDFMRHFRDDVYLAGRLMQWVADRAGIDRTGKLTMHITSFHVFAGDIPFLRSQTGGQT